MTAPSPCPGCGAVPTTPRPVDGQPNWTTYDVVHAIGCGGSPRVDVWPVMDLLVHRIAARPAARLLGDDRPYGVKPRSNGHGA